MSALRCVVVAAALAVLAYPCAADAATASAAQNPRESDDRALVVRSSDGRHSFRPTGRFHFDGRLDPTGESFESGIVVRRARAGFRAQMFDRLEADFEMQYSQGSWSFENAFLELRMSDWLLLRAGHMLLPFSLQRRTTSNALVHPERAVIVEKLVGFRALGVALDASLLDERIELQLGVYSGSAGLPEFDRPPDLAARARASPISALTFEFGYRWSPPTSRGSLPGDARTQGNELAPIILFRDDSAWREGSRHDASTGARLIAGPVMLQSEVIVERTQGVYSVDGRVGDLLDWGGYIEASWAITNEEQGDEELEPSRPLTGRGAGAWQLAVRYEGLISDRRPLHAGIALGSQTLHGGAGTLIWTPLPGVRWLLSYGYSRLGGTTTEAIPNRHVHALMTRFDFHF